MQTSIYAVLLLSLRAEAETFLKTNVQEPASQLHPCHRVICQQQGLLEVALDNELVLLGISPTDDQIVLAGHKPIELLKPVWLAHVLNGGDSAHLSQQGECKRHCAATCVTMAAELSGCHFDPIWKHGSREVVV